MKGRVILEKISFPMSVETIYTIIARDVLQGGKLYTYLPYQRKRHKKWRIKRNMSIFKQQRHELTHSLQK